MSKLQRPDESNFSLGRRIATDLASATVASFFLSPFIAVVDVSIIRNANGSMPLKKGMTQMFKDLFTRPHKFLSSRHFLIVWLLYAGTYSVANVTESVQKHRKKDPAMAKFLATTGYNMPVCIFKDRCFTQWFGVVASKPVPIPSLSLFGARDMLTVAASFSAPAKMANRLQKHFPNTSRRTLETTCQLVAPGAVQFISTPLHLLGLDIYNNPKGDSKSRTSLVKNEYLKSVLARNLRIGFAFGIGGVANTTLRRNLQARFE